jgi:hypothetical protein
VPLRHPCRFHSKSTGKEGLVRLAGIEPTTLGFGGHESVHGSTWIRIDLSSKIKHIARSSGFGV